MTVRCKYTCNKVVKSTAWSDKTKFLYEAEFSPVMDGSEENKKFYDATPSGHLKVGTYKQDVFEPGKSYYIDITEADVAA